MFELLLSLALMLPSLPSLASSAAIAKAQVALTQHKIDALFFALDDAAPANDQEKQSYAGLLTKGAAQAIKTGDPVFALKLCTLALKHQPRLDEARLRCVEAAMGAGTLDAAQEHLVRLEKSRGKDPEVLLWRARLAMADADWPGAKQAATQVAAAQGASRIQKNKAARIRLAAQEKLERQRQGLAQAKALEKKLARTRIKIAAADTRAARRAHRRALQEGGSRGARGARDHVSSVKQRSGWEGIGPHLILFCNSSSYCTRVKSRLGTYGIRYTERNVARSHMAAEELAGYGHSEHAIPVFVMHGEVTRSINVVVARHREHGEIH